MQAPAQPEAAIRDILSVEAVAALAIAALVAAAIALLVGSLTRRLLLAVEGERFHTQPLAKSDRQGGAARHVHPQPAGARLPRS